MQNRLKYYVLPALATFLTRLPFIFAGYGSEDDSWGLVQNARLMAESGTYSYSRLPGHPVQEYLLMLMPESGAVSMNLLSVLFSVLAVIAFSNCLRLLKLPNAHLWALIFSAIPAFFVAGTYTIDYDWALAFILLAFNFQLRGNLIWAGVFIGLAAGCRLTSVLVIPAFFWLNLSMVNKPVSFGKILKLGFVASIVTLICYLPAFMQYGVDF
ncbi:MAG: hypothetical protein KDC13_02340, partial [Bacteroidetes bacterium]|nr:hypothetical protein [Bacteroidota bacterium]